MYQQEEQGRPLQTGVQGYWDVWGGGQDKLVPGVSPPCSPRTGENSPRTQKASKRLPLSATLILGLVFQSQSGITARVKRDDCLSEGTQKQATTFLSLCTCLCTLWWIFPCACRAQIRTRIYCPILQAPPPHHYLPDLSNPPMEVRGPTAQTPPLVHAPQY